MPAQDGSDTKILPLEDIFHAMMAVDGAGAYFLGVDEWRKKIIDPADTSGEKRINSLREFDHDLALEVSRQPTSKGGTWINRPRDELNAWARTHIVTISGMLMVLKRYGDNNPLLKLSYSDSARFFSALPYIINHCREYEKLKDNYHYAGKEPEQIKQEWNARLDKYFEDVQGEEGWFEDIDKELDFPPIFYSSILDKLPEDLRAKVHTALKHKENSPKAGDDSLAGRMILAYLRTKGISCEKLGISPHVEDYLKALEDAPEDYKTKSLYERLLDLHAEAVPQLTGNRNVNILNYNEGSQISLSEFSEIYHWYGRATVVEMVKPDLIGAAQLSFSELTELFKHLEPLCPVHYHIDNQIPVGLVTLFREQSLEKIGRLALALDIIESHYEGEQKGGKPLRELATRMWDEKERKKAWGNVDRYVPESRDKFRHFPTFRQDIGNIIYCAGLFEERHGELNHAAALKRLAFKTKDRDSLQSLGDLILDNANIITPLVKEWETRCPDSERTRLARFVQQSFGLEPVRPVPVTLNEISPAFEGSEYEEPLHRYHIKYREAGEVITKNVPIPPNSRKGTFKYNTETKDGVPALEVTLANGTSLNIPVPGRGSYDPFGTTGSEHAGEFIGYSCSVHHASFALMLAELAALGASESDMRTFKKEFMGINPGKHQRQHLADFQVTQIWTAFNEGEVISFAKYLHDNDDIRTAVLAEPGHEHTGEYLRHPYKEPYAMPATRARLSYGYPELYPYDFKKSASLPARSSWYDGTDVTLNHRRALHKMRWTGMDPEKALAGGAGR